MQDDPNAASENDTANLDPEDWQLAFEPYEDQREAALSLAFLLTELKQLIGDLNIHQALDQIDVAIDCFYEHSDFRSVSREMFEKVIEGKVTSHKEALLRQLGIQF